MQRDFLQLLKNSFLFRTAEYVDFDAALDSIMPFVEEYDRGTAICTPEKFERRLGFVKEGECEVLHKRESGSDVRIRVLRRGDSFGIMSVFSSHEEYPTTIIAAKRCKILYITQNDVYRLIAEHPAVARNIIEFFADRIHFMNSKVSTFSASSVEQKVAQLILDESRSQNSLTVKLNKSKVANEIGVGRASLYRTLSSFSELGLLEINNKTLQIIDRNGLERIRK